MRRLVAWIPESLAIAVLAIYPWIVPHYWPGPFSLRTWWAIRAATVVMVVGYTRQRLRPPSPVLERMRPQPGHRVATMAGMKCYWTTLIVMAVAAVGGLVLLPGAFAFDLFPPAWARVVARALAGVLVVVAWAACFPRQVKALQPSLLSILVLITMVAIAMRFLHLGLLWPSLPH